MEKDRSERTPPPEAAGYLVLATGNKVCYTCETTKLHHDQADVIPLTPHEASKVECTLCGRNLRFAYESDVGGADGSDDQEHGSTDGGN